MRLAGFIADGESKVGAVVGDGIVDLTRRLGVRRLEILLADGELRRRAATLQASDYRTDEVRWQLPVLQPAHIVGIGLNTFSHFEEARAGMPGAATEPPPRPRLFLRAATSLAGHLDALQVPANSAQLDYEGEIAIVIGMGGRCISKAAAWSHIGGITCCNEGSVRDYQRHSSQVTAGKNFDRSGAVGPWLLTADEIGDPAALTLTTRVNGELRQTLRMDDLIFGFDDLVAYVSEVFTLLPGDMILTGSPAGIGAFAGNWLKPGDTVEIDVPAVGTLRNRVVAEPHPQAEPASLRVRQESGEAA